MADYKGFTLIKALLALSLLSIALFGMFILLDSLMANRKHAENIKNATTLAQDKLEALKALPYTHSDLALNSHTEANPPNNYTIAWTVTPDTNSPPLPNVKLVEVTVSWYWKGDIKDVTLKTIIKD